MKKEESESEIQKKLEILKITKKIKERYNIIDKKLATATATTLYENGIRLDKFKDEYYKGTFYLDEIVIYILNIKEIEQKIIPFPEKKIIDIETIDNNVYDEENNFLDKKIISIMPYKQKIKTKSKKIIKI